MAWNGLGAYSLSLVVCGGDISWESRCSTSGWSVIIGSSCRWEPSRQCSGDFPQLRHSLSRGGCPRRVRSVRLSAIIRPLLNSTGWFAFLPGPLTVPSSLYVLFPLIWVGVLGSLAIYDGKRFIRAVERFRHFSLASGLAAVAQAGNLVLFVSRRFSRTVSGIRGPRDAALLGWRIGVRLVFRMRRQHALEISRRLVIVGCGPLGRMVESRLTGDAALDIALLGFVDDEIAEGFSGALLGRTAQLDHLVGALQATDIVIALPSFLRSNCALSYRCWLRSQSRSGSLSDSTTLRYIALLRRTWAVCHCSTCAPLPWMTTSASSNGSLILWWEPQHCSWPHRSFCWLH